MGARCDLVTLDEYRAHLAGIRLDRASHDEAIEHFREAASFRVSEFAELSDGRRLTLHDERGFSSRSSSGGPWADLTLELLESDVLTTVLPDEDTTIDDHPWEWLAGLLDRQGVEVPVEALRDVPYVVEFSARVLDRLQQP